MKSSDRIKLLLLRNWNLPLKSRLIKWVKPSSEFNANFINGITWLRSENIAIYANLDSYVEHFILTNGEYEEEVLKLINISLQSGFVALDIGANIGIQTVRMSARVGNTGKVYSFEPIKYLRDKFEKNIALNNCSNVELIPLALSDNENSITAFFNEKEYNQGTFSLSHTDTNGTAQQVNVKPGDNVEQIIALERLDLIKIDVEGYEFYVLSGLKATLLKHRPRIIFEYDGNYWNRTGANLPDCIAFLKSLNYELYTVSAVGCELLTDMNNLSGDNIFCLPK